MPNADVIKAYSLLLQAVEEGRHYGATDLGLGQRVRRAGLDASVMDEAVAKAISNGEVVKKGHSLFHCLFNPDDPSFVRLPENAASRRVDNLGLTRRTAHTLMRNRVNTLGELVSSWSDISQFRMMGTEGLNELKNCLFSMGATIGPGRPAVQEPPNRPAKENVVTVVVPKRTIATRFVAETLQQLLESGKGFTMQVVPTEGVARVRVTIQPST